MEGKAGGEEGERYPTNLGIQSEVCGLSDISLRAAEKTLHLKSQEPTAMR